MLLQLTYYNSSDIIYVMNMCKTCNNQFNITQDRQFFCSHICQAKFAIKQAIKVRLSKPKKILPSKNCIICNTIFYCKPYRLNKAKYCSRKCLAKDHLSKYRSIHGFKSLNKPLHKYKTIKINGKYIRLHRYIMQEHLGRKLEIWEHVHHINDDPSDNRIENLEVLSNSDHQKKEHKFRKKFISSS